MKSTINFCVERNEGEIELEIVGSYSPGSPGRTYGLPENCYPPEPDEVEIEEILFNGKPWAGILTDKEEDQALSDLSCQGAEDLQGHLEYIAEMRAEARDDARRD